MKAADFIHRGVSIELPCVDSMCMRDVDEKTTAANVADRSEIVVKMGKRKNNETQTAVCNKRQKLERLLAGEDCEYSNAVRKQLAKKNFEPLKLPGCKTFAKMSDHKQQRIIKVLAAVVDTFVDATEQHR
jgi:hypothetical protein